MATSFHATQQDCHFKPTIHAAASSAAYLLFPKSYVMKKRKRSEDLWPQQTERKRADDSKRDHSKASSPSFTEERGKTSCARRMLQCNIIIRCYPMWGDRRSMNPSHPLSVYLRRCPRRSEALARPGSVWLETVERGVHWSEMLVSVVSSHNNK